MQPAALRSSVGHWATLFFGFFAGFSVAGLYLGLAAMLLAAASEPGFWRWCSRRALFWLALVWCGYVLLRWQLPTDYPVDMGKGEDARDGLIAISGLYGLVLGWWLIHRPQTLHRFLVVVPAGLVLGVAVRTEPAMWHQLIYGNHRFFAHLTNNAAGLYSAILLTGCVMLGGPWLQRLPAHDRRRASTLVGLAVTMAVAAFLFVMSESRSSWLAALVLVLVTLASARGRHWLASLAHRARAQIRSRLILGTLIALGFGAFAVVAVDRLSQESGNWMAVLTFDWDDLNRSSIGIRIAMLKVGMQVVTDAPWLGAGMGTARAALLAVDNPLLQPGHTHYHNLYLQIAAMTGLIGLAFFMAMAGYVIRQAVAGLQSSRDELQRLARFTLAGILLFGVASLFQVRYDDPRGLVLFAILTAFSLYCSEKGIEPSPQRER